VYQWQGPLCVAAVNVTGHQLCFGIKDAYGNPSQACVAVRRTGGLALGSYAIPMTLGGNLFFEVSETEPPAPRPPPALPASPPLPRFPPQRKCASTCEENVLPRFPVLTSANQQTERAWHKYVQRVYHEPVGNRTIDLNTFRFLYRFGEVDMLLQHDHCLQVCISSLTTQTYEGTPFVGVSGPDRAFEDIGFFVFRPPATAELFEGCTTIEVSHMLSSWNGGEMGASWFFHTPGSGIFLSCNNLPSSGRIEIIKDRFVWEARYGRRWQFETTIANEMKLNDIAMLIIYHSDLQIFGEGFSNGANPRTEIIVRHGDNLLWTHERDGQRGGCLDDPSMMHVDFRTGLDGTLPCLCEYDATRPRSFLNCDLTPVAQRTSTPAALRGPVPPSSPARS